MTDTGTTDAERATATMPPIELILARQLASYLALPMLVLDAQGDTFFYNEPAERLIGLPFDEVGPTTLAERGAGMAFRDGAGRPVPLDRLPPSLALLTGLPNEQRLMMLALDGEERRVEVSAFPLTRAEGSVVGCIAVIWSTMEDARP